MDKIIFKIDDLNKVFSRTSFINNNPNIKHVKLCNGCLVNIPEEIEKVYTRSSLSIVSLKELCFRSVIFNEDIVLPHQLSDILRYPTAICTCSTNVFIEVYVTFFYE